MHCNGDGDGDYQSSMVMMVMMMMMIMTMMTMMTRTPGSSKSQQLISEEMQVQGDADQI